MTTKENAIKKTFDKRFTIPLDLDFFGHPVYLYGLEENLIVRLELNSSEKVILCTEDTSLLELLVGLVVSLLELVVSPPPFFASFRTSSFIFFHEVFLPLRPASKRFGSLSFVTFCDMFLF